MTPYFQSEMCTIYHGDALDILPTIQSGSVNGVMTDPPYIIGAVSSGSMMSKSGGWADMMNSASWFTTWYRDIGRILRHDGAFWSFLNWRTLPVVIRSAMDARLPITSLAVWDKEWIGPGGPQGLRPSYEMVALLAQPGFAIKDRGVPDIIRHKVGSHKPSGHPAEKPVGLIHKLLNISEFPAGGLIVDPFLGSGTTAVAARETGLRVIGVEADEAYCEMAALRLSHDVLMFGDES